MTRILLFLTALFACGLAASLALAQPPQAGAPPALEPDHGPVPAAPTFMAVAPRQDLDQLLAAAGDAPVVYLGESHTRYADHLLHLDILRALHQRYPHWIIGMEAFQRPFQPALDAYIGGEIDEAAMLRRTEWYDRWAFDYRLYRPILRFARENRIPVIALNLPREITGVVARQGRDALTPEQKAQLPADMDRSDQAYEARLRTIFEQHPRDEERTFERFREVQLLWDEGMAETAAQALRARPQHRMAVIAGSGHLMFRSGIPNRLDRRIGQRGALILPAGHITAEPGVADYLAFTADLELPPAGTLGVMLEEDDAGVRVEAILEQGAAANSALREGDRILAIGGSPVSSHADIKLALLDTRPGQRTSIAVSRDRLLFGDNELTLEFELGGPLEMVGRPMRSPEDD